MEVGTEKWKPKDIIPALNQPRYSHSSCVIKDTVYVIAGISTTLTELIEMLCMKLETAEIKLSVDDLIESGKKVKEQIITAVESSGSRQSMPASKMKRVKKKSSSVTSSGTKHTDSNIKQVKHEV